MKEKFNELKSLMSEISDLEKAAAVLGWDRQTRMPPGGAKARARQVSTLSRLIHERYTSDRMGELLESLDDWSQHFDYESDDAGIIRLAQREYRVRRPVPPKLMSEISEASGMGYVIWREARANNDFAAFLPALERLVDLACQYANCFPGNEHPFDALLDRFEQGMTRATVSRIFDEIKGPQVALLRAIVESGIGVDDSILHQHFPKEAQLAAALEAAQLLGYDLERGRMDLTTHPFETAFSVNDVRITTRVDENFFNACLYSVLHETGHALYELGVAQRFDGLPIARGTSSGVHESQSRLFENLVGRSRAFSSYHFPILQKHFPTQFGDVDVETYYQAINKAQPSSIRVEADEVSYNLHIILRFEIEVGLIEGNIQPKDLPEIWNAKMEEYLWVMPPTDALGLLQDVHWSSGLIGHFPGYALGNIIASQIWQRMAVDLDQDALIAEGNIAPIREWLREHVHQHGRKYPPAELVTRVTGNPIDVGPYLAYLRAKYGDIYGL